MDFDGESSRAVIDVPAQGRVDFEGTAELEAAASLVGLDAAALRGELSLAASGTADLAWRGEMQVALDEKGRVRPRPLTQSLSGALTVKAELSAHAALEAFGKELWRGDWTLAEGSLAAASEVSLGWKATGAGGAGAAMTVEMQGDAAGIDPGAVAKEAVAKATRTVKKPDASLLDHLRQREGTAKTIEPKLEAALDGAPAPAANKRLPATLDDVYHARPSLAPLFQRGTDIGNRLVEDLKGLKVQVGTVERGFDPERPGGYYTLIRERVQAEPADGGRSLDGAVRQPTLQESVLRTPEPRIPGHAKEAIRTWLAETALPDRSLPTGVRAAMLAEVKKLKLEPVEEGLELVVRLPAETRGAIEKILVDAKTSEPERSPVYTWWLEHFEQPELHHIWPKWLLGDEGQVCLKLPRCIHNMNGVGLDDGGFHQRLNALFAKEEMFSGLTAEDSKGFSEALRAVTDNKERKEFLAKAHDLLLAAYRQTLGDAAVIAPIRERLRNELDRLSKASP